MSAAVVDQQRAAVKQSSKSAPVTEAPIPDIVEEKRKDSNGRVVVINRYARGNLLGKVSRIH